MINSMIKKKHLSIIVGAFISLALAYQQGIANGDNKNNSNQNNDMPKTTASDSQNSAQQNQGQSNRHYGYGDALRLMWTKVYKNHGSTLYCDKSFSTKSPKARKKADVNAEHIFPMSWVTRELQCGSRKECQANSALFRQIESDLHNIYPAIRVVNKARSNYRFGEVAGESRQFGTCDFEVDSRKRVAEPPPRKRGEIARAMLYIAHQYQMPLHAKTERLMKQWDKEDPPSAEEKRREKIIHREQGRENKFITQYPYRPD